MQFLNLSSRHLYDCCKSFESDRYANPELPSSKVYDYFLTFSDEQRLVRPSKWTLIKIAFYLNRYNPLILAAINMYGMSHMYIHHWNYLNSVSHMPLVYLIGFANRERGDQVRVKSPYRIDSHT